MFFTVLYQTLNMRNVTENANTSRSCSPGNFLLYVETYTITKLSWQRPRTVGNYRDDGRMD